MYRTIKKLFLLFVFGLPAAATYAQDTLAIMDLEEEIFSFDTLEQFGSAWHEFNFTNTGTQPLVIYTVRAASCSVPTYKREPVKPGGKGKIGYRYDTSRLGPINMYMTIKGNFKGGTKTVRIKGYIKPKKIKTG